MLNSVPPYTLLITNGDNDTFPLWYAQEVEGIRPDVTVVVATYLNIDWAARQMIRRTTPTYDVQSGPALYRGKTWPKPAGSPLNMTFAEADSIPDYVQLTEPQVFKHGDIVATIKPGYLTRDQIVALNLIKAKVPERPIYFSTAHSLPTDLGLDRYMLSEGLVQKLMDHPIVPSGDTLMIRGMYLDLPGTYDRWKMFKGPKSLIAQGSWVDRSSLSIPIAYVSVGLLLEQGLAQANDTTAVQRINGTVTAMLRAANIH